MVDGLNSCINTPYLLPTITLIMNDLTDDKHGMELAFDVEQTNEHFPDEAN